MVAALSATPRCSRKSPELSINFIRVTALPSFLNIGGKVIGLNTQALAVAKPLPFSSLLLLKRAATDCPPVCLEASLRRAAAPLQCIVLYWLNTQWLLTVPANPLPHFSQSLITKCSPANHETYSKLRIWSILSMLSKLGFFSDLLSKTKFPVFHGGCCIK